MWKAASHREVLIDRINRTKHDKSDNYRQIYGMEVPHLSLPSIFPPLPYHLRRKCIAIIIKIPFSGSHKLSAASLAREM